MRVVLVVLLTCLAAPADACPHGTVCLASAALGDAIPAPIRTLRHLALREDHSTPLQVALREPASHLGGRTTTTAMPWIWQVLRQQVYARMPRYEQRRFSMVASPVVISGTFDTVPGLGFEGEF